MDFPPSHKEVVPDLTPNLACHLGLGIPLLRWCTGEHEKTRAMVPSRRVDAESDVSDVSVLST